MKQAARCGGGPKVTENSIDAHHSAKPSRPQVPPTTHPLSATVAIDSVDLTALRLRLVGVRRRLLERLAADWPADRRFPDSAWTKLLADVQGAIQAVDAVVEEGGP